MHWFQRKSPTFVQTCLHCKCIRTHWIIHCSTWHRMSWLNKQLATDFINFIDPHFCLKAITYREHKRFSWIHCIVPKHNHLLFGLRPNVMYLCNSRVGPDVFLTLFTIFFSGQHQPLHACATMHKALRNKRSAPTFHEGLATDSRNHTWTNGIGPWQKFRPFREKKVYWSLPLDSLGKLPSGPTE